MNGFIATLPTPFGGVVNSGDATAPAWTFTSGDRYGMSLRNCSYVPNDTLLNPAFVHYDMHQVVSAVSPGTTILQVNGYAPYISVDAPATAGGMFTVGVGYGGNVLTRVDGAAGWGIAVGLTDNTDAQGPLGRRLVGAEFDFSPQHTNTKIQGIVLTGIAGALPTDANGFELGALYGKWWQKAFISNDSASIYAVWAGRNPGPANNANSQIVAFNATNSTGVAKESRLYADAAGLRLTSGDGSTRDLTLDNGTLKTSSVTLAAGGTASTIGVDGGGTITVDAPNTIVKNTLLLGATANRAVATVDGGGSFKLSAPNITLDGAVYALTKGVKSSDGRASIEWDASTSRYRFYIDGSAVMTLDAAGNLRTKGTITASTTL